MGVISTSTLIQKFLFKLKYNSPINVKLCVYPVYKNFERSIKLLNLGFLLCLMTFRWIYDKEEKHFQLQWLKNSVHENMQYLRSHSHTIISLRESAAGSPHVLWRTYKRKVLTVYMYCIRRERNCIVSIIQMYCVLTKYLFAQNMLLVTCEEGDVYKRQGIMLPKRTLRNMVIHWYERT